MTTLLLTLDQADEAYPAIGRRKFRLHIERREIPFYKVGRRVYLNVADIEKFIAERRVEPGGRR